MNFEENSLKLRSFLFLHNDFVFPPNLCLEKARHIEFYFLFSDQACRTFIVLEYTCPPRGRYGVPDSTKPGLHGNDGGHTPHLVDLRSVWDPCCCWPLPCFRVHLGFLCLCFGHYRLPVFRSLIRLPCHGHFGPFQSLLPLQAGSVG